MRLRLRPSIHFRGHDDAVDSSMPQELPRHGGGQPFRDRVGRRSASAESATPRRRRGCCWTAGLLKTAEDNLQAALGRYQAGVGTIIDVLTAQNAAATVRTLRINAELNWKVSRAQMALALGRLTSAQPLAPGAALP